MPHFICNHLFWLHAVCAYTEYLRSWNHWGSLFLNLCSFYYLCVAASHQEGDFKESSSGFQHCCVVIFQPSDSKHRGRSLTVARSQLMTDIGEYDFYFLCLPQKITICLCFNLNCAARTKKYWVGGLHGHLGCTEADSSAKGIFFAKTICKKKKKQIHNSGLRQLGCVVLELCFELEAERCVKETMREIGVYLLFYWQLIDGSCLLSIKKDALPWGYLHTA